MTDKTTPPALPGYHWTTKTGYAPWDKSDTDPNRVVVGMSPQGLALYDRKTGIIHHMASAKPH